MEWQCDERNLNRIFSGLLWLDLMVLLASLVAQVYQGTHVSTVQPEPWQTVSIWNWVMAVNLVAAIISIIGLLSRKWWAALTFVITTLIGLFGVSTETPSVFLGICDNVDSVLSGSIITLVLIPAPRSMLRLRSWAHNRSATDLSLRNG
jgi:hypothetical protein